MTVRTGRGRAAALARACAATAVVVATAACGTETGGPESSGDPTMARETEAAETPTGASSDVPTPIPTATRPAPVTEPSERAAGFARRLLPAARLPGFNRSFTWRTTATTRNEGRQLAGRCHKFELMSIGAWKVARRGYAPTVDSPGSASATVVEFPDEKTAKRAYAVLDSWREDCPRDHDGDPKVGDFVDVRLPGGAMGGWYLLTYGDTFDAQGFARRGDRIVVLQLATEGQDYNYPRGKEPMVKALKKAVTLL